MQTSANRTCCSSPDGGTTRMGPFPHAETESLKPTRELDVAILKALCFMHIALIPVVLHMLRNSNLPESMGIWKYVVPGIIAWLVVCRLIRAGLLQAKAGQQIFSN